MVATKRSVERPTVCAIASQTKLYSPMSLTFALNVTIKSCVWIRWR